MARVLVTAALGNVGAEVARAAVRLGLTVRVADRRGGDLAQRHPGLDAAPLDFLDRSTWSGALDGCDQLFLVRPPPLGDMATTLCPFLDAAWAAGVEHVVFLSVAGADRMKWVPHRKVELHLIASGRKWTLLRPGFFAQNLKDAYRRDIVEEDRLYVPAAQGRVAFIDARDIAEAAARVFQRPTAFVGQALTLTGGVAVTFAEVAQILSAALGRVITYRAASIAGYAWHLWRARRLPLMQIIVQTILHVGLRRGDAEHVDPTLAQLLERRPRTLKEYVADALPTWRK